MIVEKIKEEMERMKVSRDTGDVKTYIPWGKRNDGFPLSVQEWMRIRLFSMKRIM